jgi:hypothetical protein
VEAEGGGDLAALVALKAQRGVDELLVIFSGVFSATSSMFMPPSVEAMMAWPLLPRSNRMAK